MKAAGNALNSVALILLMKYGKYCFLLLMLACNGRPFPVPPTPETVWIDMDTHSDTIVTNIGGDRSVVYYAPKNWQILASGLLYGYRNIAIRFGDSILVKPLNDNSTNYDGPFLLRTNPTNDTLTAQNFLDTSHPNPARIFVKEH